MSIRRREWKTATGEQRESWVVDYKDQLGKRRLKTFERKKDATAFETTMRGEVRDGLHVADSETVTIREAGENWIKAGEEAGLERSTLDQYRQHLHRHIIPFIGSVRLSQLNVPTIRGFQDRLRGEARSPAMVKIVTVSLGGLLSDAQERGQVSRNAVREMASKRRRGKARQGEKRRKKRLEVGVDIPTPSEANAIITAASDRWRPLLMTAIFTGLRASELRGLRWSDLDLHRSPKGSHGEITVRQRADRYQKIGMPKSEAGQRTIDVGPLVANTLLEWKLRCPKGKGDLVFPTGAGNIESHVNIVRRGYGPAQAKAGVVKPVIDADGKPIVDEKGKPVFEPKYPGLHALRHFFASWCINSVENGGRALLPKTVQTLMGHSSITMTMDRYGHLFPANDNRTALGEAEQRLMTVRAT